MITSDLMQLLKELVRGTFDPCPTRYLPLSEEAQKIDSWWMDYFTRSQTFQKVTASRIMAILRAQPRAPLQAYLSNDELQEQIKKRLPSITPTPDQLSCFAIGAEIGFSKATSLDLYHHAVERALNQYELTCDNFESPEAAVFALLNMERQIATDPNLNGK